jgi:hypothetical protein
MKLEQSAARRTGWGQIKVPQWGQLKVPRPFGSGAPDGAILGARVEHLGAKEALLADDPRVFFTTQHFDGYPAILVRLDRIAVEDLEEVVTEAWLVRAPSRLADEYLDHSG